MSHEVSFRSFTRKKVCEKLSSVKSSFSSSGIRWFKEVGKKVIQVSLGN